MKKKNGFTLVELLIVLAVIGIIAAVTIPLLKHVIPDKNKVMAKKAYSLTSQIIDEMINDNSLYPEYDSSGNQYSGFDNQKAAGGCSGATKFGCLFITYLNGEGTTSKYTSQDGIQWKIDGQKITVDVNPSATNGDHKFSMTVANDGKITVNDTWAKNAISVTRENNKDFIKE